MSRFLVYMELKNNLVESSPVLSSKAEKCIFSAQGFHRMFLNDNFTTPSEFGLPKPTNLLQIFTWNSF